MMDKKLVQSQLEKGEFQYVNGGIARTILICVVVSVIVQLGLPFLASYGRDLCSFTPYIVRNTFCADRESVYDKRLTISKQSSASYLPELFPIETWKDVGYSLISRTSVEQTDIESYPAREKEALAALLAAQTCRQQGNLKRAKSIIEHALALAPTHPDVLTEYGVFHELVHQDLIEADLCYARALTYDPRHTEAAIRRQHILPIVSALDAKMLRSVQNKREKFSRLPHTAQLKRAMRESYFMHIYHTVAIEGSTLTLGQTRSILESGMAVAGKSVQEHNEVIGMDAALRFLNHTLIAMNEITCEDILEMHRRVLGHVNPIDAGRMRSTQVYVGQFTPVAAEYVREQMNELVEWLNAANTLEMDPIERAAIAHYKLVVVHPFVDGNGRTARLLMNLILMRAGFPPVIFPVESRAEYYATLNTANLGDLRPFVRYVARHTDETLQHFINTASTCNRGDCDSDTMNELSIDKGDRIVSS